MQSPKLLHRFRLPDNQQTPGKTRIRRFFLDNLPLKILSLFLAFTIWAFVAPQRRGETTEFKFQSPLVLKNIPSDVEITSDLVQSVSVLVRVPRTLAKSVNPNLFQVAIDLRNQLPGTFEYKLTEKQVSYNNEKLPKGLEVLQISPNAISLVLEELVTKVVPVKARIEGSMENGFVVDWIEMDPAEVEISGPRSVIGKMKSFPTEPLDVQDLNANVEMRADLDTPPEHVRIKVPEETNFIARIFVTFASTRILLREIPVIFENPEFVYRTSTETLNVHLEGPDHVMSNLTAQSVFAVIDLADYPPGDYRGLAPSVVLPERVRVLEQWPILDLFVLKRKKSESSG